MLTRTEAGINVFGVVESGSGCFWFYQIKIWEYNTLIKEKKRQDTPNSKKRYALTKRKT